MSRSGPKKEITWSQHKSLPDRDTFKVSFCVAIGKERSQTIKHQYTVKTGRGPLRGPWLYIPWHLFWQTRPDYKTHSSSDWMSVKPQGLKLSPSLLTNNLSLSGKDGSQFHFYQKQVEAKQIKFLEPRDWNPHPRPQFYVLCVISTADCC